MVFNSLTFAVFFAVVLLVTRLPLPWRLHKGLLLVASYLFYAAWNPPFALLIAGSTVLDFLVARRIADSANPAERKALMWLSLGANLGLLAMFKYGDFAIDNVESLLQALGVAWTRPAFDLILPVGISFYTFQTLSYTIDVYRGRLDPRWSFLDFALFVSFFPQLVAGPIVRAVEFLPQLDSPRRASADQLGWGLSLMVIGLFEKVVLGDGLLARPVDLVFGDWERVGNVDAWIGTLGFASQIFFDFAGYSTSAIGAALALGFAMPDNFRFPYGSLGFQDFWRRWHISLSGWLRDYLYISLGGNRKGPNRTQVNLMLTMLLGGLWHGAAWRFVFWGFLHGFYQIAERWFFQLTGDASWTSTRPARWLGAAVTFLLVCVAWVPFRAESFTASWRILRGMAFTLPEATAHPLTAQESALVLLTTGGLVLGHWWMRDTSLEAVAARLPWPVRGLILGALALAILLAPGERTAFIYFQF